MMLYKFKTGRPIKGCENCPMNSGKDFPSNCNLRNMGGKCKEELSSKLKWESDLDSIYARTPIFYYSIHESKHRLQYIPPMEPISCTMSLYYYDGNKNISEQLKLIWVSSIEEAKEKCQEHYDTFFKKIIDEYSYSFGE